MFRLDYLSCLLTILATVLVGRKSWTGLLVSIVNSLIVCVIGFRTSQFGFIPANVICICVYAFSVRSWLKKTHAHRIRNHARRAGPALNSTVLGVKPASRPMTIGQEPLKFNSVARPGHDVLQVAHKRKGISFAKRSAVHTRHKVEIPNAKLTGSCGSERPERILRNRSRVRLLVDNAGAGSTAPLNLDVADMNRMIALSAG
jgi:hypothetical protein